MSCSLSEQSHPFTSTSRSLVDNLQSTISLGKYGNFQANHLIGRPYHLTYEVLDKVEGTIGSGLRVIPAAELYAGIDDEGTATPPVTSEGKTASGKDGIEYEVVGEGGEVILRTNRETVDDAATQRMTMDEIERLKAEGAGSGKDLIAKILESHSALDQKTTFALAKYTLRKTKKYLRRFTVLPLDVPLLARWMLLEKEPMKIMEIREEMLALIGSWSNIHCALPPQMHDKELGAGKAREGRWLMIDETAGLLVAAVGEKLGVLDPPKVRKPGPETRESVDQGDSEAGVLGNSINQQNQTAQPLSASQAAGALADSNTITLIHANSQPNLSLLRYFGFDAANPTRSHPLQSHLKMISWLQLLAPTEDSAYTEPETVSDEVLRSWKSGKRGNYYRKRRRWERIKSIVDETRAGGFDGLIIASVMNLASILHHTVPLLRGAAQVVIYSPHIEPLAEVADFYSKARRTAFVTQPPDSLPTEDFPVDPTLLLTPTIQTARCKPWQVLPGRTHPLMSGRGGAEGYLFTATRVLPAEGKVEARGKYKRRKLGDDSTRASSQRQASVETKPETPAEVQAE